MKEVLYLEVMKDGGKLTFPSATNSKKWFFTSGIKFCNNHGVYHDFFLISSVKTPFCETGPQIRLWKITTMVKPGN